MDLRRLRTGEWIAGLSGVALLVSLFLPWYHRGPVACIAVVGVKCPNPRRFTGWEALSVVDVVLAFVALFAIFTWVVTVSQRTPAVPIAADSLLTLFAIVATVVVAIRVADMPDLGRAVDRSGGGWVALAAAVGTLLGGSLAMRDQRRSRPGKSTDLTGRPAPPQSEPDPLPPPEPAR
jgi:hypothetical protein